jgi:hypothetical protein
VDYDNAFSTSASFRWLLLVPSGGSDMFALICAHFASVTFLCCPLRGSDYLFDQFFTICNYFCIVLIYIVSIVSSPHFRFYDHLFLLLLWIRSGNDLSM